MEKSQDDEKREWPPSGNDSSPASWMLLDVMPFAAILADRDGLIRRANVHAAEMFGFTVDEMLGISANRLLPEKARRDHSKFMRGYFENARTRQMRSGREFMVCRKDGTIFPVDISLTTVTENGEKFAFTCLVDLTTYHQQQSALARANRALELLSASNRTLLRATEMQPLLDEVCRLAIEKGGYDLAWIGQREDDSESQVRPIAQAGPAIAFLDNCPVNWGDNEFGRGPTGTAIRTGRTITVKSFASDPSIAPWKETAEAFGFQSSVALPLRVGGEVFGALALYSVETDAFTEEEIRLLTEVVDDLAFGIETLQLRKARDQAEEKLQLLVRTDFVTGLPNRASLMEFLDEAFTHGAKGRPFVRRSRPFQGDQRHPRLSGG